MKINKEEIPVRTLDTVQSISAGIIIAMLVIMIITPTDAIIGVNMGIITIYVITLLLSTSLLNCRPVRGIVLNAFAILAASYTQVMIATSYLTSAYGVNGLNIVNFAFTLNYSLILVCITVWMFTTLNTLKTKEETTGE